MKNKKDIMMKVVRNSITKIAEKKAYANCIGFMYEPKKPEKYSKPYKKMEENATYHIKSAYYKEGKNYWLGYRASKMDVAGVISYFYRDSNKTPYADAYGYKNSYKSLNYTTSSDRLVALAKKYYKSGAVDEDITYGSTFYLN